MPSEIVEKLFEAEARMPAFAKPKAYKSDLASLARMLVVHGSFENALVAEKALYGKNAVLEVAIQRAATATSLQDLADNTAYDAIIKAFTASLRSVSVFDALQADMIRVPMRGRLLGLTAEASGIAATVVNEMTYAPHSKLELEAEALSPRKAVALVALTDSAWSHAGALAYVESEMRGAISTATNREFLSVIASDAESASGTGATASNVLADVAAMLAKVELGDGSKPYLIIAPGHAKRLSMMHSSGIRLFPELGPMGGEIANMPVLVSSELPADSSGPKAMLLDASAIAFDDVTVEMHVAESAAIQLTDDPQAGAQQLISLWQMHLKGIRARRWWAAKVTRPYAVCVLNQTQW